MHVDGADRWGRARSWLGAHPVELAFAALAAAWAWYALRISGEFFFWSDDLRLIDQGSEVGDWLDPYNHHLSVVIVAVYRGMAEVFGLPFQPYLVLGVACLLAVPVAYFVTTRRALGSLGAAVLAMPLLWYEGMVYRPAGLNHLLVLLGAIGCAAALDRGRRADWVLAASVLLALASAGGGLVVVAACLIHNTLTRAPLRRWLAVLAPAAAWFAWWTLIADSVMGRPRGGSSASDAVRVVREMAQAPFSAVALGNRAIGALLVIGFVVLAVNRLRRGVAASANLLSWTAGVVLWAVALVRSRGQFADPNTFRYSYLALGFLLLAVVPRTPMTWRFPSARAGAKGAVAAAAVVLALGGLRASTVRPSLQESAELFTDIGRDGRGTLLAVQLGPSVIPDDTPLLVFGSENPHGTAGDLRELIEDYGSPDETSRATIDEELVDLRIARAELRGGRAPEICRPFSRPVAIFGEIAPGLGTPAPGDEHLEDPDRQTSLWAPEEVDVYVQRWGDEPVFLIHVPAGRSVRIVLPYLDAATPWQLTADGACPRTA